MGYSYEIDFKELAEENDEIDAILRINQIRRVFNELIKKHFSWFIAFYFRKKSSKWIVKHDFEHVGI